jgi:hypothetical protein
MPTEYLQLIDPIFKVADTEAGLAAGEAFQCQLNRATLIPTPSSNAVPATGCAPATNLPGKAAWAVQLDWLQDWSVPGGGLSAYAYVEESELKWFSLATSADVDAPKVVGQAYVTPGAFGGVFGGPAAAATATWNCAGRPTITYPPEV